MNSTILAKTDYNNQKHNIIRRQQLGFRIHPTKHRSTSSKNHFSFRRNEYNSAIVKTSGIWKYDGIKSTKYNV